MTAPLFEREQCICKFIKIFLFNMDRFQGSLTLKIWGWLNRDISIWFPSISQKLYFLCKVSYIKLEWIFRALQLYFNLFANKVVYQDFEFFLRPLESRGLKMIRVFVFKSFCAYKRTEFKKEMLPFSASFERKNLVFFQLEIQWKNMKVLLFRIWQLETYFFYWCCTFLLSRF